MKKDRWPPRIGARLKNPFHNARESQRGLLMQQAGSKLSPAKQVSQQGEVGSALRLAPGLLVDKKLPGAI